MSQATKEQSALERYLPILTWLPAYRRDWLRTDIVAGLAIMVMIDQVSKLFGISGGRAPEQAKGRPGSPGDPAIIRRATGSG